MESTNPNPGESTIANADLWTRYFQNEWGRWMNPRSGQPSPLAAVAESTAAQVAGFLTLVAAGPIAWLYNSNRPQLLQLERRPGDPASVHVPSSARQDHAA